MNRISDKILDEIQQRCDIAEVISSYFPLKKAGRNFKACCPFHHEKTPSFIVSPDKQIFHCFGCGAGGDVFSFIMQHERIDFPEAVRFVAAKAGVRIEIEQREQTSGGYSVSNALTKINELAAWYFYQNFIKDERAQYARKYLQSRQIDKESIEKFRIGVTFDLWDGLLNFLRKRDIKDNLLVKSGLVIRNAQGKLYDRFRNRIMFPIFNGQGKIVGFGGRVLEPTKVEDSDKQPKYINSPETDIYIKGRNLYGFNVSKEFIRRQDSVVIVEGYLDCIIPYQFGIKNIVASLGTSFTIDHVRLLRRYTRNIIIVFDSDAAGEGAALRSLDLLVEEGMNVRIVRLEPGFDPDAYVRKYGQKHFQEMLTSAKSRFDYELDLLLEKYNKEMPEQKTKIAEEMLSIITKIKNAILRTTYIKRLSEVLAVPEEVLLIELKKIKAPTVYNRVFEMTQKSQAYKVSKIAELMLMSLMFENTELVPEAKKVMTYDEFSDPVVQKIAKHLFDSNDKNLKPTVLLNRINDQRVSSFISNLLVTDLGIKDRKKSFEDCIKKIKKDKIQLRLNTLQQQINKVQQSDEQGMKILLKEYHHLKKEQGIYEKTSKKKN